LADNDNCGSCGNACSEASHCGQGTCLCNDNPRKFKACDGICVMIDHDRYNCGGCNIRCAQGQKCKKGFCEDKN
jgi:hypothetical protein